VDEHARRLATRAIYRMSRWGTLGAGVLAAMAAATLAFAAAGIGSEPPANSVSVWISPRHPGRPVARRFLGLSFELSSLGEIASLADRGDLVRLLRSLGPGVVRFGGTSADTRVAWIDPFTPQPAWASSTLEASELQALRTLAMRSGWRVLLTLNLAHYDPQVAARETAAAQAALGPWLAGVEVGNEPDSYARHGLRPEPWTPAEFGGEVASYRRAIRRLAPGVAVVGPDASGSAAYRRWAPALMRDVRTAMLTGHHYALGCADVPAPSIARLLSFRVQVLENRSLARYMSFSKRRHIGFRLDETNSVSCGGVAEVSDTLASALWAVGYGAKAMAAGVSGINLHGNISRCDGYSPLCVESPAQLARGALTARPDWYALLLLRFLVGDRALGTSVLAPQRPNLSVAAFRSRRRKLQLVLVDREAQGAAPASVSLHVGRSLRHARTLALTGPSLEATSGVRLGGREVSSDGSWRAPRPLPSIAVHRGVLSLTVAPSSAVLVTVSR
jgi:hypothetical protein